jgi:hypothetical protein
MSQLFDLDAFVRELDSPNALDALRRHSGQAPQQSQLLQSTLGEPLTAPQLSPYNTMQSVPIAQQQAYLQQQVYGVAVCMPSVVFTMAAFNEHLRGQLCVRIAQPVTAVILKVGRAELIAF